jgi:TPR repeat protein
MKKWFILAVCGLWATALFGGYSEGVAAYKKGDFKTAYKEFLLLAKEGNEGSQWYLGYMYLVGEGVTKDSREAVKWYKKAAEQGLAPVQVVLGDMYEHGIGATKDLKEAVKWYREAAEQGDSQVQSRLGNMYADSRGVTKDPKEAVRWYRQAAEQGNADAQGNLGVMYHNGEGVFEDKIEAYKWYVLAVANGGHDVMKKNKDGLTNLLTRSQLDEGMKRAKNWQEAFDAKQAKTEQPSQAMPQPKPDELWVSIEKLATAKDNKHKWLLIIAPEKYDKTSPVVYSQNSAEAFGMSVMKLLGIPKQNTIGLINADATTGAIKDAVTKISELAEKGDTIYFYYSGHGIPSGESGEAYILPKDKSVEYVSKEPDLKLSNIYKTLESSRATKVVAIVDACFSGMTDGEAIYKGTAGGILRSKIYAPSDKMVILTAGKDTQFSNSYEAKGHRLFSYFIVKALLDGRRNVNDIYQDVRLKVKDESRKKGGSYEQEPQMAGNGKLGL